MLLKTLIKQNYIHPEDQYISLINDLIENGVHHDARNGDTLCGIGSAMYFSLEDNTIPILTTKKVALKTCLKELLWFMRGCTNNQLLKDQNVKIWDLNASREFLDSRGLSYEENDLGPVYGHQWRHFNAEYNNCHTNYQNQGIDQLQRVIDDIKNPETRYSRRHIVSAWNPCQIDQMALPPCHVMFQFHVLSNDKLSCTLYQRSGDVGLGVPFNIMSYSALAHIVAHHCGLEASEFIYYLGNTHIYADHIEPLKQQVLRKPYDFPKFYIKNKHESIDDYVMEDFEVVGYKYHEKVEMKMSK